MSNAKKPHMFERVLSLLTSTSCSCVEQAQDPQYQAERNILKMHGFNVVDLFPTQAEAEKYRAITVEELRQAAQRKGWPRLEWDGNHYNEDQYDLIPADEHGEMPPIYKLRENAVSVESAAEQNADQRQARDVPHPVDGFDKTVDEGRMAAERRLDPNLPSIQELESMAAEFGVPSDTHQEAAYDDRTREARRAATAKFYELMQEAGLMPRSATAGNGTPPQNNAGLYQGRIAEIDPTRWPTVTVNPLLDQFKDHNMTNLTYPSLSDEDVIDVELEDDESPLEDGDGDPETHGEEEAIEYGAVLEGMEDQHQLDEQPEEELIGHFDGENLSISDPVTVPPQRIVVAIQDNEFEPERIRFYDNGQELVVEAASQKKGKSFHVTPSSWWKGLSPERRRAYLESHPNSRYAKAYRKKVEVKKKKAAKRLAESKKGSKGAKQADAKAVENEQVIKDSGITLTSTIPEELDNEQDKHLDQIENEMLAAQEEPEEEEEKHPDDVSEDEPEELHVDEKKASALLDHSKRKGFFKPVVSAVKKRASNGTLGAMGRMMNGTMREGDKEKAIKGIGLALAAITVVGVGAGIAAIAGPGMMMKYVTGFVDAYDQFRSGGGSGDGDGFDFTSESADEQRDNENDEKTSDEKDKISDKGIADLSSMFLRWLDHKAKTNEDSDEEK